MQEEKRRGQIAGIVMMVLLLLWVGAMGLLTRETLERQRQEAKAELLASWSALQYGLRSYQPEYRENFASQVTWRYAMESPAMGFALRDADGWEFFTPMAWGTGREDGALGPYWNLRLSDDRQAELTSWLWERAEGSYRLFPPENELGADGDGTVARLTGVAREGQVLEVERIELIHPDGTTELVLDGEEQPGSQTLELAQMDLHTRGRSTGDLKLYQRVRESTLEQMENTSGEQSWRGGNLTFYEVGFTDGEGRAACGGVLLPGLYEVMVSLLPVYGVSLLAVLAAGACLCRWLAPWPEPDSDDPTD